MLLVAVFHYSLLFTAGGGGMEKGGVRRGEPLDNSASPSSVITKTIPLKAGGRTPMSAIYHIF